MRNYPHHLIALLVVVFAALMVPQPVLATHWASTVSLSPNNPYQGVLTRFSLRVNNAASDSLYVTRVWVHFCWQGFNTGYIFFESTVGFRIFPGSFYDFTADIQVPEASSGSCVFEPQVTGATALESYQTVSYCNPTCSSIDILIPPPLAVAISPDRNVGVTPLSVKFYTTVTGGVSPYSYSWTFGDGGTSTEKEPLHTYTSSGTWTATLVVVDSQNRQQSKTTIITVNPSGSPSPTPAPSPTPTPTPMPTPSFWQQYWYLILAAIAGAVGIPVAMKTIAKRHPQESTSTASIPTVSQAVSPAMQPAAGLCAGCGARVTPDLQFCTSCGRPLS